MRKFIFDDINFERIKRKNQLTGFRHRSRTAEIDCAAAAEHFFMSQPPPIFCRLIVRLVHNSGIFKIIKKKRDFDQILKIYKV